MRFKGLSQNVFRFALLRNKETKDLRSEGFRERSSLREAMTRRFEKPMAVAGKGLAGGIHKKLFSSMSLCAILCTRKGMIPSGYSYQ